VLLAGAAAPAVLAIVVGGSADPLAPRGDAQMLAAEPVPCCVQLVAAAPTAAPWAPSEVASSTPGHQVSASRWRVIYQEAPRALPAGVAPERGLQVKTILAARSISAAFPEIHSIGGVRPDALKWHPNGLALDVMIPNPSSSAGISLGNEVVAFALKNAARFGLQDAIWRGTYYTPSGPAGSGYGHYDHVHITTTGGGYPTGGEVYIR
jgi:hypothetical protein